MAIILNKAGYDRAVYLISKGGFEIFDEDINEIMPTINEIDSYLDSHNMEEYGLWFLGIETDADKNIREHYVYPHGDLHEVQYAMLEHTKDKAAKEGHKEIAQAAQKLLALIDESDL